MFTINLKKWALLMCFVKLCRLNIQKPEKYTFQVRNHTCVRKSPRRFLKLFSWCGHKREPVESDLNLLSTDGFPADRQRLGDVRQASKCTSDNLNAYAQLTNERHSAVSVIVNNYSTNAR